MLPFGSPSYFRHRFFFFFFVNRNDVESAKLTAASCNPKRSGAGQEDRRAVSVVSVSVFNHREAERGVRAVRTSQLWRCFYSEDVS